jgi:hypothetical protein
MRVAHWPIALPLSECFQDKPLVNPVKLALTVPGLFAFSTQNPLPFFPELSSAFPQRGLSKTIAGQGFWLTLKLSTLFQATSGGAHRHL